MPIRLGANEYGESHIRVLRVARQQGRHDVRDLSLSFRFEGAFEAAHSQGDNRKILPGDTLKNTVYALARQHSMETAEEFALHLNEHFLTYNPQISRVMIETAENIWARVPQGGKPHPSTFAKSGEEKRICHLSGAREGTNIRAGIENLMILKTADTSFDHFLKDPYTTLQPEQHRILATMVSAHWLYGSEEVEFATLWQGVRQLLLEIFAEHNSKSLQHTVYAMGEGVLKNFEQLQDIHLAMDEQHFQLVDLEPLGMDNPGTVYLPLEEPEGAASATISRG